MHWVAIWDWLVANGLFRDVLATAIGLGSAKLLTVRIIREHKQSQAQIADLLDTSTPGGLTDVLRAVKDGSPEDETPDSDDGEDDEDAKRKRRGHGTSTGHGNEHSSPAHHGESPPPAPDHDHDPPPLLTHLHGLHGR